MLTFLFREMPELIDAGYVYIAKPPLYKLKTGNQEIYIEKESELEEVAAARQAREDGDLRSRGAEASSSPTRAGRSTAGC